MQNYFNLTLLTVDDHLITKIQVDLPTHPERNNFPWLDGYSRSTSTRKIFYNIHNKQPTPCIMP